MLDFLFKRKRREDDYRVVIKILQRIRERQYKMALDIDKLNTELAKVKFPSLGDVDEKITAALEGLEPRLVAIEGALPAIVAVLPKDDAAATGA